MGNNVFTNDIVTDKELIIDPCVPIAPAGAVITAAATISAAVSDEAKQKGEAFAAEITRRFVSDFEQTAELVLAGKVAAKDRMAHVSAFIVVGGTWDTPVLVADCQSRSHFIVYNDELYLFHAPIDRDHIGALKIDTQNLANTNVVFHAKMDTSCFYPFIQYYKDGELAISYTVERQHIRLAEFTLSKYL